MAILRVYAFWNYKHSHYGAFFTMCDACKEIYNPPVLQSGVCKLDYIGTSESKNKKSCDFCITRIQSLEAKELVAYNRIKGKRHAFK